MTNARIHATMGIGRRERGQTREARIVPSAVSVPRRRGTRKAWSVNMADEYGADLVTVLDEDGTQHEFELVDAIETDEGRYVALLPVYEEPSELVNDDGELILLEVAEEDGEEVLVPIEDEATFDEIAEIFEERLADLYEIEEMEEEPAAD